MSDASPEVAAEVGATVVTEVLPTQPQASQPQPGQPQQEQLDLQKDLKVGYVVGLKNDGNFVFSVVGKEPGLMELLGVHHHATSRVKKLYSANQVTDDALTLELAKMVDALGGMVNQLTQKVDKLLNKVDPPKPQNIL
jgi:hypothetical protein